MNKMNFKSKFSLFNKSNAPKSIGIEILPKETINQNASWFQSMEPINYAKNQTRQLYEIDNIEINEVDTKVFKDQLFKNLKTQMDKNKDLIKKKFLTTSDGSLNVGLNVILIDSLLKVMLKNSYSHILGNMDYQFSLIAVGGYGRGELAPHSDLDILFLLPNKLTMNDNKKIEEVIQLILYILWDLGYTVGHSTRTIKGCIEKCRSDLTI